jgi:hypothetical protein
MVADFSWKLVQAQVRTHLSLSFWTAPHHNTPTTFLNCPHVLCDVSMSVSFYLIHTYYILYSNQVKSRIITVNSSPKAQSLCMCINSSHSHHKNLRASLVEDTLGHVSIHRVRSQLPLIPFVAVQQLWVTTVIKSA